MLKITQPIGMNYNMSPSDVRKIKQALNKLGYYKIPDYGLTEYPDKALIDSIESFQKSQKLNVDGIVRPDSKTILAINKKLREELPGVKGPTLWCPICGAPHGGSKGDLCPDCSVK